MTLTADRVADELDRTAALLDEHGTNTTRRVHDLSHGAGGSGGPGQRNAISDPTGSTAIAPPDPLAQLETRWQRALARLIIEANDAGCHVSTSGERSRGIAASLRYPNPTPPQTALRRLHSLSLELDHIIYECVPIDRERAEEELREKDYLTRNAECCQACESITGDSTDPLIVSTRIVSGLCRPGCYDTEARQIQRGTYTGRADFITNTKTGVARGEIHRTASPLWCTAVPVIHEGDPAA